jgi:hypothetical protein
MNEFEGRNVSCIRLVHDLRTDHAFRCTAFAFDNLVDVLFQAAVLSEADYNRTLGRRRDLPSLPLPMHAFSRDG